MTAGLRGRLLRDPPAAGALNMALDETLARGLAPNELVLRLYAWTRPTVSFGRNEPTCRPVSHGLDVVRRPTGGRAVLHDREVTYAIVLPHSALGGPRSAYHAINLALAEALASLGAEVAVAGEASSASATSGGRSAGVLPLTAGPCFQSPAPGEVIAAAGPSSGRKLVGSAQVRIGRALLQHGSIILSGDQSRLAEVAPGAGGFEQPATLADLLGDVRSDAVADAVARTLTRRLGRSWHDSTYTSSELDSARDLIDTKYGLESWTWRR